MEHQRKHWHSIGNMAGIDLGPPDADTLDSAQAGRFAGKITVWLMDRGAKRFRSR